MRSSVGDPFYSYSISRYDPDHMTSLKTHRRIELIDESRRMLDRVVKALLEKYREDPGMDKKLLGDIRTIFVEDLKDEVSYLFYVPSCVKTVRE